MNILQQDTELLSGSIVGVQLLLSAVIGAKTGFIASLPLFPGLCAPEKSISGELSDPEWGLKSPASAY